MFYCENCRKEKGWPESYLKSLGPCEVCDEVAVCYDMPSTALAALKDRERKEAANDKLSHAAEKPKI